MSGTEQELISASRARAEQGAGNREQGKNSRSLTNHANEAFQHARVLIRWSGWNFQPVAGAARQHRAGVVS